MTFRLLGEVFNAFKSFAGDFCQLPSLPAELLLEQGPDSSLFRSARSQQPLLRLERACEAPFGLHKQLK